MSPSDYLTGAGLLLTGIGLIYGARQMQLARKVARAQFLLQLDQMLLQHQDVHARLSGLGWPNGKSEPETPEEWIAVDIYMGLFERIQVLIEDSIVDFDTFDRLYGYRVFLIVNNPVIRQKR